jgi:NADPH:quinone reductase-like Zn-dependent oxidoreductase
MRAMTIVPNGTDGDLVMRTIADPVAGPGDLLVAVRATACNRADLSQRRGGYVPGTQRHDGDFVVAGLESAGEVVQMGSDVSGFCIGDRVMAMCSGGYAELLTVDHRLAITVPTHMSWVEAAATPVAFMTQHDALVTNGEFQSGQWVLVTAASSAVAMVGVKIAKYLGAGGVIGTVAKGEHVDLVKGLGVDVVVDAFAGDVVGSVRAATGDRGVDVVIDHVGGSDLQRNMEALRICGRLVSVGRLGPVTGSIDLDRLAYKRLKLIGVTFRTRSVDDYAAVVTRMLADLGGAIDSGALRPVVDRVFPLSDAREAQDYMAADRHFGKIVLEVS